ncbi:MAG: SMI1/KNR4 family protein [Roseburia sp.]|nr:SMI1/KNR4 family protein [Roseburia sp.]
MLPIKNKVIRQCEEITEEDLQSLEREYNFKFPEDIKRFYMKYNGGRLERCCYMAQEDAYVFSDFLSIKTGYSTLNDKMSSNYIDDWWPKELIPFGYDGGGNSFCFHADSGQIYYIYEDTEDDEGNVPVEYVAPDFLSFINNMVEE